MTVSSKSMAHTTHGLRDFDEENPIDDLSVHRWQIEDVVSWASKAERCTSNVIECLRTEGIDGEVLMALTEDDIRDFRYKLNYSLTFSELKKLWLSVQALQLRHGSLAKAMGLTVEESSYGLGRLSPPNASPLHSIRFSRSPNSTYCLGTDMNGAYPESFSIRSATATNRMSVNASEYESAAMQTMSFDGRATNIPPEFFKTAISLGYSFLVTWITSFVMVIVHERVPDMKRYPPLPDIFLDNVPHIPWAFHMCEVTGTLLFSIWLCVCIFHRYRTVLLRRFFALAGTVFLLRCVTMLITSLSVPGTHLQCNQNDYAVDDTKLTVNEALQLRISRAYTIWSGLGMSIQGVRTCGDYMFSGHTVALTLLNFFITEYTPRNLYFLHTLTWLLNMFGIFFILAAHEHYSIDVFVAFYITSRLFLYYHTLANNQALMSRDSNRTRIWFPMFSYFENSVNGIIPNEYDTVGALLENFWHLVLSIKDSCMLTARRFWLHHPNIASIKSERSSESYNHRVQRNNFGTLDNTSAGISSSSESSSITSDVVTNDTAVSDMQNSCSAFNNNVVKALKIPQIDTDVKKDL